MNKLKIIKKSTHLLVSIFTIFYIVTGFGISDYQIIEPITFGLLTKSLAFKLHYWLIVPFIIIIIFHIYFSIGHKIKKILRRKNYE